MGNISASESRRKRRRPTMSDVRTDPERIETRGSALRVPRSRGALSGLLLLLLGAWGALIPFIGPLFSFGLPPDTAWTWTAARGWLEVLPGVVTAVGGLILLVSANRITACFGAWLAVAGGAWFIVGPELAHVLHIGDPGLPASSRTWLQALESLAFFYGLGALIIFFAAGALGRLSVRSVRDVKAARRREAAAAEARAAEDRAAAARVREHDRSVADSQPQRPVDERPASEPGYQPAHAENSSSGATSVGER